MGENGSVLQDCNMPKYNKKQTWCSMYVYSIGQYVNVRENQAKKKSQYCGKSQPLPTHASHKVCNGGPVTLLNASVI